MPQPLVDEAMKKAAIAWISAGGAQARAVWCMPAGDALWVVSGPGEQQTPDLDGPGPVLVTLRGDHGGRIVTWPAEVSRLEPDSDEWAEVAPQLAGKRLNASGDLQSVAARWAAECAVYKLAPADEQAQAGASLPDGSLAEPPRETPVRRRTRAPFRLHRVRR